jgi:hypothetical protein
MLDTYLVAPNTLKRLRSGPSGVFIDDFADGLKRDGYSAASAIRYLRAADHLGRFMLARGGPWRIRAHKPRNSSFVICQPALVSKQKAVRPTTTSISAPSAFANT